MCAGKGAGTGTGAGAGAGAGAEPSTFTELSDFLEREVGLEARSEVARVVDVATNPDSGFLDRSLRRFSGAGARPLSVEDDLAPVVAFLREDLGASRAEVRALVQAYPRVLGYDVEARLGPLVACLSELGVKDPVALLQARPSLLGLDPGEALQRIVDYLRSTGESPEAILQYLETSL